MERKIRTNKRIYKIILLCILLLILIASLLYNTYCSNVYYVTIKEYNGLKEEVNTLNSNIDKLKDDNKDIDETINNTKEEYFKYALELENDILNNKTNKKIAYLTFDDGPYYNTYKVLDILDKYKVQATFFTTSINGEYCYDNKEEVCYKLYNEYLKGGHTIANHTYTHGLRGKGLYNSSESFMDAVIKQEEHIKNITLGYVTNIVRFPGGSDTAGIYKDEIINKLRERKYGWVDWSAQDGDGGYLVSKDVAWSNIKASVNDNIEVILLHDYNNVTTEILPELIEYLQNNGYVLLPLFYESNVINK